MAKRRPTYRDAVLWIANNDDDSCMHADTIADQISVVMAADLFGVEPLTVAIDVVRERERRSRRPPVTHACGGVIE